MPTKRTVPETFVIDSTPWSCVVRCTREGCAWRANTHTKASAYRLLESHMRRVHNDLEGAKVARRSARRAS